MTKHYEAYFENEDGAMWGAAMGCTSPEAAKEEAFGQLSLRQLGMLNNYRPSRLLIFECTPVETYAPLVSASEWSRVS